VDMNSILLLRGEEIRALLAGREAEVMEAVGRAYLAHGEGDSSLPHSTFLRFPHDPGSRIIGLPAYVGGAFHVAGMKWIASFPRNLEAGVDRASAVIILNSADTGRPIAILEGSLVSARRTAASAALAAAHIHRGLDATRVGIVGCGPIAFEIVRFLRTALPEVRSLLLFDMDGERARYFATRCEAEFTSMTTAVASTGEEVLGSVALATFATTAAVPHVHAFPAGSPLRTVLHVSLRDLAPELVFDSDNVVDDLDHVCRAQTSVHLASELSGGRDFVRCSLADILAGREPARRSESGVTVFSPFGLGVLDMALAALVYDTAVERGIGTPFQGFAPEGWRVEGTLAGAGAA